MRTTVTSSWLIIITFFVPGRRPPFEARGSLGCDVVNSQCMKSESDDRLHISSIFLCDPDQRYCSTLQRWTLREMGGSNAKLQDLHKAIVEVSLLCLEQWLLPNLYDAA